MSCHIRLEEKVIIVIPFEPDSFKFSNGICKAKPIKVHILRFYCGKTTTILKITMSHKYNVFNEYKQ